MKKRYWGRGLGYRDRAIVFMRDRCKVPYMDIGSIFGISVARTIQLYKKARIQMRMIRDIGKGNKFYELEPRTQNVLREYRLTDFVQVVSKTDEELLGLRGFGMKCLQDVRVIQKHLPQSVQSGIWEKHRREV